MAVQKNNLQEGPISKSLLRLAVPIVIANVLQAAYQLIDAFWVGRLGGAAVAAVSVSAPITFLTIALGVGFAVAGSTLIAQYFGAGNRSMVNHVASQTLLMILFVSVVLGAVGYIFTPAILKWVDITHEVYDGAVGFMRVSFIGLVFNFFFFMFQSIMRGVGEAKLQVYIVLGTVILNFIIDPVFIYGWGPVPAYGVKGAAIATVSTQSIAAFIGLGILLKGKYGIHLSLRDFRPDFAFIRRAFLLGFPASIEQSARALGLTVLTFLIAGFGTLTVAAYGVGSNVLQVVIIPAMGLSMAISTLVGQNIGAGNIARAAAIGRLGTLAGFSILSFIGVIVFFFATHIVRFFVPNDPGVISEGAGFLRIISLSWGFMAVQLCLTGVFRASGNMLTTMVIALVSQWVLQFPLAYMLSRSNHFGITGLWWSFTITNVSIALITILWYVKGDWKKTKLTGEEDRLMTKVSEEIVNEEGIR